MYIYNAKIINVVDGDTFDMDIDLGFYTHIHVRTRLLYVNTPEKRGSEKELGLIVKDYATKLLTNQNVTIRSEGPDTSVNTDSFGRWLVVVSLNGKLLHETYNKLGINKNFETYSEDNVEKLLDYSVEDITQILNN